MEVDCQPEESIVPSFDEDCVVLGDVKDMRLEAEAVVNDVLFAVSEMHVSQSLNSASDVAYINVETTEGNRFCLELTEAGLRVRRTIGRHSVALMLFFPCPSARLPSSLLSSNKNIALFYRWLVTPSTRWRKTLAPSITRLFTHFLTTWAQVTEKLSVMLYFSGSRDWNKMDSKGWRSDLNAPRVVTSGILSRWCGCIWVLAINNQVSSNIIACHVNSTCLASTIISINSAWFLFFIADDSIAVKWLRRIACTCSGATLWCWLYCGNILLLPHFEFVEFCTSVAHCWSRPWKLCLISPLFLFCTKAVTW